MEYKNALKIVKSETKEEVAKMMVELHETIQLLIDGFELYDSLQKSIKTSIEDYTIVQDKVKDRVYKVLENYNSKKVS